MSALHLPPCRCRATAPTTCSTCRRWATLLARLIVRRAAWRTAR